MERDIDNLIRNKVLEAERQTTEWRKDKVWTDLSDTLPATRKRTPVYYYAAACVALIVTVVIFIQVKNYSIALEERFAELNKQLQEMQPASSADIIVSEENCEETVVVLAKRLVPKMSTQLPMALPTDTVTVAVTEEDQHLQPSIAQTLPAQTVKNSRTKKRQYAEPIIGVYSTIRDSTPVAEKKKGKIHWFKNQDNDQLKFQEKPDHENFTARIN